MQRWTKAKGLQDVAIQTYTQLTSLAQGYSNLLLLFALFTIVTVTTDTVKHWIEDEKAIICSAEKIISRFTCFNS